MEKRKQLIVVGSAALFLAVLPSLSSSSANAMMPLETARQGKDETVQDANSRGFTAFMGPPGKVLEGDAEYADGQKEFAEAKNRIQSTYPDEFVTAIWAGPSSPNTTIYVRPRAWAHASLRSSGFRVVGMECMAENESSQVAQRILASVTRFPGISSANVSVDSHTHHAEVTFRLSRTSRSTDRRNIKTTTYAEIVRAVEAAAVSTRVSSISVVEGSAVSRLDDQLHE